MSTWAALRPVGARIAHVDGTVTPLELTYDGLDEEGCHLWLVATPLDFAAGDVFLVDTWPPRTTIQMPWPDRRELDGSGA